LQIADADAHQSQHAHIKSIQQAAYVPIASFGEKDFEPRVLLAAPQVSHGFGTQPFAIHSRAMLEIRQERRIRQAVYLYVVGLIGTGCWMRQQCSPCWIIAEQQKTLARFIQSSHGRKPGQLAARKTAVDGFPALLIFSCRHQTARFIQHDDHVGRRFRVPFNADPIGGSIHWEFGIIHEPAVDAHPPGFDPFRSLSAGTQAEL
jgi:hypothetical protein